MTDLEQQRFEAELARLAPAPPPDDLKRRLASARTPRQASPRVVSTSRAEWLGWLRTGWWVPAAASLALILVLNWKPKTQPVTTPGQREPLQSQAALKADNVELKQDLVSDFDAVARLSSGEPVRFRCRKWMDQVVVHDRDRGLVIQQSTPRVEVVSVRFETY